MRFHVVALPQSGTTKGYSLCGFSQKTMRFCWMMKDLGHKVFLYGPEENEAECDEHIVCINKMSQVELCGGNTYLYPNWNPKHPIWEAYNAKVTKEILKRQLLGDFVCILGGNCYRSLGLALPGLKVVEYGIGYKGHLDGWRVWESHAWRGYCLGKHNHNDFPNPHDAVIHSFYDENEFDPSLPVRDYVLFVGRVTRAKGIEQACQAASLAGVPCKVLGFGERKLITHGAEYLGCVSEAERNTLMSQARAVICPTQSWEPFGNVACEAQLCGTPVICSNWGGFVETVEHEVTGFRCSDVTELAESIAKCDGLNRDLIRCRAISLFSMRNIRYLYQVYFERLSRIEYTKCPATMPTAS